MINTSLGLYKPEDGDNADLLLFIGQNMDLIDSLVSGKETPAGAQAKAVNAENNAKDWSKSFGLGWIAKDISSSDLNVLDNTGFYKGVGCGNKPPISSMNPDPTNGWFFIIHLKHDQSWKQQIAYEYGTGNTYQRGCNNAVWSAWTKALTEKSFIVGNTAPSTPVLNQVWIDTN